MKNLIYEHPEVVDDLPNHAKFRSRSNWYEHGKDYPWKKVYRFLTSRIGKPWDRVFSEFVHLEWIPRQYRTQEQISCSVILNTFIKDGKVWYFAKGFGGNERPIERCNESYYSYSEMFYVHPKTKILCHYKPKKVNYRKIQEEEEAKTFRILGDYHQLLKFDGIWYEVKGKIIENSFYDNLYEQRGPRERLIGSFDKPRYYYIWKDFPHVKIVLKRQLSHKELKKYGIANDIKPIGKSCPVCGNLKCTLKT